ncbi:hypothetical protein OOK29_26000 [Streptomyces phaeochromogenes]|uniref:hypothetical protein n=1 Tax=Streptomyces phaeochromogenes TaxID=1923 RepID=UPI00225975BF|nr:hypothetical protein [Streptomyces phaeochromogenes]MCX5601608.1 hypothetical protein [Streptomyces phaeochromogenes]
MDMIVGSTIDVRCTVTPPDGVDISSITPRMAVIPTWYRAGPQPADWHDAAWTDGTTALLLVGPNGAVDPALGDHHVYIQIDPPGAQVIVEMAGHLSVTVE